MSYVRKSLVSGERVIYQARFHWLEKLMAFVACFAILGIIWVVRMWTTEIAVTNRRLIFKRGWIARKAEEMSLRRIEEVNLRQSIPGRLLGYGKVLCQGTGGSDILLPTISDPMRFKKELQEAQANAERQSSPGR